MVTRKDVNAIADPGHISQRTHIPPYPTTPTSAELHPPDGLPLNDSIYPAQTIPAKPPIMTTATQEHIDIPLTTHTIRNADSGSDWDSDSDDEKIGSQQALKTKANSNSTPSSIGTRSVVGKGDVQKEQDTLLPMSLRIGRSKEEVILSNESDSKALGPDPPSSHDLTMATEVSTPLRLENANSKNPFLRNHKAEQKQPHMESSAPAWSDGSYSQLPIRSIPRKALSQVSQDSARGRMAGSYGGNGQAEPQHPQSVFTQSHPLFMTDENPWISIEPVHPEDESFKHGLVNQQEPGVAQDIPTVRHSGIGPPLPARPAPQPENQSHPELPARPNREAEEQPPPKPPRPPIDGPAARVAPIPLVGAPGAKQKRQRNEFYHIRHIRWRDVKSSQNLRQSPILIQNANGPCPLLALVNALVLSTPPSVKTPLIETLRTREQVSLGLLLDAVFDELMSGRRGGSAQELPDVGELYSFLITLHTGMNVNPRLVTLKPDHDQNKSKLFNAKESPGTSPQHEPGSFEDTREMRLYSTFSIPLVHGWLPGVDDTAYAAFSRAAPTYEDAQNIQFREEELEHRRSSQELSVAEHTVLADLAIIKEFFSHWPTQLTEHGLTVLNQSLKPGQISILFRNDHFCTLYKEPRSGQLMTLVTDAGYANHDEIVWESLVDINGTYNELFAGDFNSVSHNNIVSDSQSQTTATAAHAEGEWITVGGRNPGKRSDRGNNPRTTTNIQEIAPQQTGTTPVIAPPESDQSTAASNLASNLQTLGPSRHERAMSEQEDRDLALALQLQEEEEESSRIDREARQREDELSQQFLSQQTNRRGPQHQPVIPPRRSNQSTTTTTTANNSTWRSEDQESDSGPPTYEQAAATKPFIPPPGHPLSAHAPAIPQSLYAQQSALNGGPSQQTPTRGYRRLSAMQSLIDQIPPGSGIAGARRGRTNELGVDSPREDREENCAVM